MLIDKKKISVILPNYNHGQYLTQALDSIKNQTYDFIEPIFIDDGSTDNSVEVFKQWNAENNNFVKKFIFLEKNYGKWYANNKGIELAEGELIAIQDLDDRSCEERLERELMCMQKTHAWHVLCGFYHCWNQDDIERCYKIRVNTNYVPDEHIMLSKEVTKNVYQGRRIPGINHYWVGPNYEVHGASTLFFKQLWDHGVRFLPGNMGLRCQIAEDSSHNTSLTLLFQKTVVLKEQLYCYRRNSATNGAFLERC